MSIFGERLRELRTSNNMGQKELGALLNVSDSSIRKYESGDRTPAPDAIKKLANFFNVSTDYLLGSTFHDDTSVADLSILLSCSEIVFDGEIYKLDDELRQGIHDAIEFVLYKSKKRNKK